MEKNSKNEKPRVGFRDCNAKQSYQSRFLKNQSLDRRGDKAIYIRPQYHERLLRISHIIGEDSIPLYAYLDNILKHHFDLFEEEIVKDYNRKNKPIF